MSKTANFKRSSFALFSNHQLNTLKKPYYGAIINSIYYAMLTDFTERSHVLSNRAVESLLCSLHERPVLKISARIAVLSKVSLSISSGN